MTPSAIDVSPLRKGAAPGEPKRLGANVPMMLSRSIPVRNEFTNRIPARFQPCKRSGRAERIHLIASE